MCCCSCGRLSSLPLLCSPGTATSCPTCPKAGNTPAPHEALPATLACGNRLNLDLNLPTGVEQPRDDDHRRGGPGAGKPLGMGAPNSLRVGG